MALVKVDTMKSSSHRPLSTMKTNSLNWKVKSKIGSFDKISHVPGGGNVTIPLNPLNWRQQSKVGSFDNINHKPKGGQVVLETKHLQWKKTSKIGSLDSIREKTSKEQTGTVKRLDMTPTGPETKSKLELLDTSTNEHTDGYSAIFRQAKRHHHKKNTRKTRLEKWNPLPDIKTRSKTELANMDENKETSDLNFNNVEDHERINKNMDHETDNTSEGKILHSKTKHFTNDRQVIYDDTMGLQNNIKDFHLDSKDLNHETKNLSNDKKDHQNGTKDLQSDTKDLHNDSKDLHNDLNDLENYSKDLHNDSKDLHNDSKDLHNDSKDVHNDSKDLRNDSKDLYNDTKDFDDIENLTNDTEDLHNGSRNLHNNLRDFQNDIKDLQNDTEDLHDDMKDLHTDSKNFHKDTKDPYNNIKNLLDNTKHLYDDSDDSNDLQHDADNKNHSINQYADRSNSQSNIRSDKDDFKNDNGSFKTEVNLFQEESQNNEPEDRAYLDSDNKKCLNKTREYEGDNNNSRYEIKTGTNNQDKDIENFETELKFLKGEASPRIQMENGKNIPTGTAKYPTNITEDKQDTTEPTNLIESFNDYLNNDIDIFKTEVKFLQGESSLKRITPSVLHPLTGEVNDKSKDQNDEKIQEMARKDPLASYKPPTYANMYQTNKKIKQQLNSYRSRIPQLLKKKMKNSNQTPKINETKNEQKPGSYDQRIKYQRSLKLRAGNINSKIPIKTHDLTDYPQGVHQNPHADIGKENTDNYEDYEYNLKYHTINTDIQKETTDNEGQTTDNHEFSLDISKPDLTSPIENSSKEGIDDEFISKFRNTLKDHLGAVTHIVKAAEEMAAIDEQMKVKPTLMD